MLYDQKWDGTKQEAPKFGRRWHSLDHLDIRPVLWSLRNRPADWERGYCTIIHKPSKHEFWVANGLFHFSLYRADCSCRQANGGSFSFIQKIQFGAAYRCWKKFDRAREREQIAGTSQQFAEHFLG